MRRLLSGAGAARFSLRERAYAHAFIAWSQGRYRAAAAILEGSLLQHPTDILTVRTAHDVHFFNGDSLNLRWVLRTCARAWLRAGAARWTYHINACCTHKSQAAKAEPVRLSDTAVLCGARLTLLPRSTSGLQIGLTARRNPFLMIVRLLARRRCNPFSDCCNHHVVHTAPLLHHPKL